MWICYCNTNTYTAYVETRPRVLSLSLQLPVTADQPNPTELKFVEYRIESMELIFSPLRFAASAVVR